ncbi:putative Type IV fimbrial biogenesis protein FimT [Vibrio nigripulchritudo MADA3029]|uniref:pilus assembly FimT family protein n=1 Tax=Vibrio nigripulchritudo TaxID=28173 RepID=UPI0003B23F77|nr:GspH/FimT family pseudopilin [Vibrio nigripulchritudo]CCN47034.1 putative Type IV fimbrial biogenesis protein FimT [Vibrio nigripulchritudo MADA3020]CCN50977.1 putative Type IV fimbrial biogenesis protein FimT [Vibrio nigripulchritudo MADA3021]CCN60495.1 putative Type IV fimbrial biogenesis protein FimT [Vibrio nigripulchritudo MADA3029]
MARGFTLIELLITLAVMTILLGAFAPSYKSVTDDNRINRLANELQGFLIEARSEAVMRNRDLWVHFTVSGASVSSASKSGDWIIDLRESSSISGALVQSIVGKPFKNIYVSSNHSPPFKIEGVNGRIEAGTFKFSYQENMSDSGSVITHFTNGRVKVCGSTGNSHGFTDC